MPPENMDHGLFLATLAFALMVPMGLLVLLAVRFWKRRPGLAHRCLGLTVSLTILGVAFLAGEAWMRWGYDEPQNLGPWAARNWYFKHRGVTVWFRGGCSNQIRSGRLSETEVPVLVLGDSIVWGQGVDPGETFASILQEEMGVPVFPAGKRGWSTVDQLEWLGNAGVRPRAMVLSYAFNDIQDALPDAAETFQPLLDSWFHAPHRDIPLLGRSYLVDHLVYRFRELGSNRDYDRWVLESYARDKPRARHLEQLAAVGAWASHHEVDLAILVWPPQGPDPEAPFLEMEETFAADLEKTTGAPVLVLRPALVEAGITDARTYRAGPREGHPGAEAHRVAAELVLPFLREALEAEASD